MPGQSGLNPAERERMEELLQALEPECKRMDERARGFVEDQIARFNQYGERMFCSPKQWAWLNSLYEQYVDRAGLPQARDDRTDTLGEDDEMDDEIPF